MKAVIKRTSFASGNYVNAAAFATKTEFPEFIATSRLIDKVKSGPQKIDAVLITAIDRPAANTKAKSLASRTLYISIPDNFEVGDYQLKSRPDVDFSLKDADGTVYESVSGKIKLEPALGDNVKGSFQADLEYPGTNGETFTLKGNFQVLKAG
ncbi:hypothetical protein [Pseudomonas sp. Irchel 3E19]|uniref:hypothetical protein n=1 Tax=Pseudomonas sp. Irchel 3E19 TaxID=2008981 RepID=UPI000BA4B129|nr:hypothetical protein [Pseudomonas sp. Irchel 3E19]